MKDPLKALFEKRPNPKLPPRYEPKVTVRVTDDRTRQIVEFSLSVPAEGEAPEAVAESLKKLGAVFERLGYGSSKVDEGEPLGVSSQETIPGGDEHGSQDKEEGLDP